MLTPLSFLRRDRQEMDYGPCIIPNILHEIWNETCYQSSNFTALSMEAEDIWEKVIPVLRASIYVHKHLLSDFRLL